MSKTTPTTPPPLPPQPRVMHWIDVRDHLPDDEITVLVCWREEKVNMAYHCGAAWLDAESDCALLDVTHWMDLPEPPATLKT